MFSPDIRDLVRKGDIEKVNKTLAKHPEAVNPRPKRTESLPIIIAIRYCNDTNTLEMMKLLVENGANLNDPDQPALSTAAELRNLKIIEYLLDHGARPDSKGENGYAVCSALPELFRERKKGEPTYTKACEESLAFCVAFFDLCFSHGLVVSESMNDSVMYAAVCSTTGEIVEYLVKKGFSLIYKARDYLPIFDAIKESNLSTYEYLISQPHDLGSVDENGDNVVGIAARVYSTCAFRHNDRRMGTDCLTTLRDAESILRDLLARDIECNKCDFKGMTPFATLCYWLFLTFGKVEGEIVEIMRAKSADKAANNFFEQINANIEKPNIPGLCTGCGKAYNLAGLGDFRKMILSDDRLDAMIKCPYCHRIQGTFHEKVTLAGI